MSSLLHKIVISIKTLFVIICLVHISSITYFLIYPEFPDIRIYKRDLQDIEFPLSFKICVSDVIGADKRYKNFGYTNDFDFFAGESMYNSSMFGWSGHTENGSSVGTVKGSIM